ncbi:FKBP-type peptidyl-prolyl cis-trans isomerase [Nocardia camponoti]|uniref:Peptidyl-prolyl cis-trans isomerase n=1 Tax=Nocardia camponoti TaxID=1616106 RepID=A0A917QR05_9NOCA|nr:FKBP-type peptidyl-prolyl cis-trans isomerase [Nocardia camponoti]GGK64072.1 peptidyl-prolyl cis-trans isomerase [Nocardia camponoti]
MHSLAKIVGISIAATAALTLSACGSDSSTTEAGGSATQTTTASKGRECTADDIKVEGAYGNAPTITIPDNCDAPKKLISKDLIPGNGIGAAAGQPLTMNYELVTWSDKQVLDSSFKRGKPFGLTLGSGQVIQGWDQGLLGVQQGTRRLLIVPPDLGYGAGGNGVAPNETLVFVTDAVQVGR